MKIGVCSSFAILSICIASIAYSAPLSKDEMQAIYEQVKTPYKYGMIMQPEPGEMLDNPNVFRHGDSWYMIYIRFDGKGYETRLAKSKDLLSWEQLGIVLNRGKEGAWDSAQSDGCPILLDENWNGTNELKTFNGRYWMMYIGGALHGYETDPLSTGVAWTLDPSKAALWTRIEKNPVLSPSDADVRDFERRTIYRHYVVEDKTRSVGGRFVTYYNGKRADKWFESIGMAVSDDLCTWRRIGDKPVVAEGENLKFGINGDPMIRKIGDTWVMFFFGYSWGEKAKGAFDTFACSRDLKNWQVWEGKALVVPSEPWDKEHAHKPWVICHNGVVYHFYCAVGDKGRGLALATSREFK